MMDLGFCGKRAASFVLCLCASVAAVANAGHNREDKEQEVRDRFEWVVFGGEYHPWQLAPAAVDVIFGGGELTKDFAIAESKKFSINFAEELATRDQKAPIAGGIMSFTMWEKPLGVKVNIGDKYVPYMGVLKKDKSVPKPPVFAPEERGYSEFRRRLGETTKADRAGLPALPSSVESQWIQYIINHCVNNTNTREGYKEFRRRIDLAFQYRYAPGEFKKNYEGRPNLDLDTIPAALPQDSVVGGILKEFVSHCAGNPDGEAGYKEFHRRVSEEIYPSAIKKLSGNSSVEAAWTMYILWHLAGNFPTIEKQVE